MRIRVSDGLLHIGDVAVRYANAMPPDVVARLVIGWRSRLDDTSKAARLPFSIDDEAIEAFEVERRGSKLHLRVVKLDNIGFATGLDSFVDTLETDRPVIQRRSEDLATCDQSDLVEALCAFERDVVAVETSASSRPRQSGERSLDSARKTYR